MAGGLYGSIFCMGMILGTGRREEKLFPPGWLLAAFTCQAGYELQVLFLKDDLKML